MVFPLEKVISKELLHSLSLILFDLSCIEEVLRVIHLLQELTEFTILIVVHLH